MVIEDVNAREIGAILKDNIRREARLVTDEAGHHKRLGRNFASHDYVNHGAGEYGRGEIHTNTAEGYFSVFKRGMKGVYQHFGKRHLHRYVAEFEFRYNYRSANGVRMWSLATWRCAREAADLCPAVCSMKGKRAMKINLCYPG